MKPVPPTAISRRSLLNASAVLFSVLALPPWLSAAQFKIGDHTFTVPDGFEIELVAGTNLARRPVSASFDDKGRLYVTDSSGSNLPPSEQLKNPTHRILRLEDTNGDGRFDKTVVFADKVMFPQGCLWHDGSVYMAGPPSIWKFTDTDGDGVADQREEWFKGGTLTGCANDIHGPHLGPDGYIYWTKGAFAEQTHTLWNGRKLNDRAAHILRAKPDGSGLDVVMTGGMDNPVEVAFTVEGETVFTSTFIDFTQPGRRDGIAHAAYGAVFGKENDALEDGRVQRTGPGLAQPFVQFGAGAPSGLCRYQASAFGDDYRDNLFATTFNLHKITRHRLRPSGATYASTDSDFVVSDNIDFHPTDVLEDADGSLLIVDTGGWYKLCCPSSQLAKEDVLGGIYRVRRTAGKPLATDERLAAYRRLTGPPTLRDYSVAVPLKRAALKADPASAKWFRDILNQHSKTAATSAESAHLARIAAEGLGRIADRESAEILFNAVAAAGGSDEVLNRSLTFALIQIGDVDAARAALRSANPSVQGAALVVLDQISGANLTAEDALSHLAAGDPALRRIASWIAGRHSDWGTALAGSFRQRLDAKNPGESERTELQRQLAQFARNAAVQELIGNVALSGSTANQARLTALRAMSSAGLKETPGAWTDAVIAALASADAAIQRQGISTARSLPPPKKGRPELGAALDGVGRNEQIPADARLEALAAIPGGLDGIDAKLFDFLKSSMAPGQPVSMRSAAASVLARARLDEAQLASLTDALKTIGPLELPKVLPAFDRTPTEAIGLRLLAALKECRSLSSLRAETLRPRLTNFPATVQAKGEELIASLNADAAKQAAHLSALLADVHGKGDVRRGQAIFNSAKAACSACHAIGYLGGKVGPDLTRISEVRSERDLLEAIVYPSASFVRSYEPMLVATRSGDEFSGVLRKDGVDEVVLATGPDTEIRLARADITEMRPGSVSIMPQGLDEQLSRQELADLVAFLRNTKWGAR